MAPLDPHSLFHRPDELLAEGARIPGHGHGSSSKVWARFLHDSIAINPDQPARLHLTVAPTPGPAHGSPASAVIAQAVAEAGAPWALCPELGETCLPHPGRVVALSELRPAGPDRLSVWITYAEAFPSGQQPAWEVRYYRLSLRRGEGGWVADALELLEVEG